MISKLQIYADNRLDALFKCLLVKLHHAKKVSVIGQRNRRHAQVGALPHQHRNPDGTVDDRVLGVQMQMNEGLSHGVSLRSPLIDRLSNSFFLAVGMSSQSRNTNGMSGGVTVNSKRINQLVVQQGYIDGPLKEQNGRKLRRCC